MKDASVAVAVRAHTRWIKALMDYMEDGKDARASIIMDDHVCEIGRWLEGEGKKFSGHPEFARLKEVHVRFHRAAGEVIRLVDAGERRAAYNAMRTDGAFARLSTALLLAFDALDEKVHLLDSGAGPV